MFLLPFLKKEDLLQKGHNIFFFHLNIKIKRKGNLREAVESLDNLLVLKMGV